MYLDQRTEVKGAVRELAATKLEASDTDRIEFGEYTWDSGYCETCSYTEHEFVVLLNGETVYDSRENGRFYTGSTFGDFQEWLTS